METHVDLYTLVKTPFELLRELERRAISRQTGRVDARAEWVGVGLRLGDDSYVVPRDEIREVMQLPSLTRVPGANAWLLGLANVRGQLIPIVDLKQFCGSPAWKFNRQTRVVLVNDEEVPMGIVVDEVFGFRRFLPDDLGATPSQSRTDLKSIEIADFVTGIFRREGDVWPVLSFLELINSDRLLSAT